MSDALARLDTLLAEQGKSTLAARCREALIRAGADGLMIAGPLPAAGALRVYGRRLELDLERGPRIEGFPELVGALERYSGSEVLIAAWDSEEGVCVAFTDPDVSELIGVLQSPGKSLYKEEFYYDPFRAP